MAKDESGGPRPPEPPLTFLTLLQSRRNSELLAEADRQLTEVVEAVKTHGGKGKLTLTLELKLGNAGQLEFGPALATTKPARKLPKQIVYADDDGRLHRRDPTQGDWVDDLSARRNRGGDDD
jgi:hypothetical protein